MDGVRHLYLLRHAKSSWDDPELADPERPLNKRGRSDCKLLAAHLSAAGVEPGAVICSPARRAEETLERVGCGLPDDVTTWTEERAYGASSYELLELLRELPADFDSVMLVGHNPGIEALAELLASEGADLPTLRTKYPTGALATLTADAEWSALRPGAAALESFVRPIDLR